MPRPRSLICAVLLLGLISAACGRDPDASSDRVVASPSPSAGATASATATDTDDAATSSPSSADTESTRRPSSSGSAADPTTAPNLAATKIELVEIARLDQPVAMSPRAGESTLYVAEKGGTIRTIPGNKLVLDMSSEVTNNGEQGLLGLTFRPDGKKLYVYFTNKQQDQVVREYAFSGDRASSPRTILQMDDPYGNHNGGNLAFGPDGHLYIATGDGGSAGDPQNNAQNINSLLGKILRIDPDKSGSAAYSSPTSNPFAGRDGRDEIWAYGLRNPWRFSFDRSTGALWIGDVGQGDWEEVNVATSRSDGGENYGWRRMEGRHPYGGNTAPSGHRAPIYEYSHAGGNCSITGGYVYRGSKIPTMRGAYVFADFCVGKLRAFTNVDGRATGHRFLGPEAGNLASFGEDRKGELYVMSQSGGVFRIAAA